MENKLLSGLYWITGAASLALWLAVFVPAAHAEKPGLERVVSSTSAAVNRMSEALARGQFMSVTRLGSPEDISEHPADRMIAAHNLCLAWIARGEPSRADAYCQQAVKAADDFALIEKGGDLTVGAPIAGTAADARTLAGVMRANIASVYDPAAGNTQAAQAPDKTK